MNEYNIIYGHLLFGSMILNNMQMKKYYFDFDKEVPVCNEICKVHNNGTMIGSISCREDCEYFKGCDGDANGVGVTWIKCERLREATKKAQ